MLGLNFFAALIQEFVKMKSPFLYIKGNIFLSLACCLIVDSVLQTCESAPNPDKPEMDVEQEASNYLDELEVRYSTARNRKLSAKFDYATNMTDARKKISEEENIKLQIFQTKIQKEIGDKFASFKKFKNESIRRQLRAIAYVGSGSMPQEEVAKMTEFQSDMEADFQSTFVCDYGDSSNCKVGLGDVEHLLYKEWDPKILDYYWTTWHDAISKAIPSTRFEKHVSFRNTLAKANGFKNMFEMWMNIYDDESPGFTADGFRQQMFDLWEEAKPMYDKLHAYVRMKLKKRPGYEHLFGKCGYIPIHLTGSPYGQDLTKMDASTKPYPELSTLDATAAMVKKNYTVKKMYKVAENFFIDMGFPPMSPSFWNNSLLEHPNDGRKVQCHPWSYDLSVKNAEDVRIKMCATVFHSTFVVIHHELGHLVYYQQYSNLNIAFRGGANPGFHEAIGDAIALSVATPSHLQCKLELDLGLDPSICNKKSSASQESTKMDLNFLYLMALNKVIDLPFALSTEAWRWEVFEGLSSDQYNHRWWGLTKEYQGFTPPANRTSPNLFDPSAKYHIVADVEYLRYFLSLVLQFQFYEGLCKAAGEYDPDCKTSPPLFKCDFSGSKEAGKHFSDMLKMGSSKVWPEALEAITGSRKLSVTPMKHYFLPLFTYIDEELKKNGEVPGFGGDGCKENN